MKYKIVKEYIYNDSDMVRYAIYSSRFGIFWSYEGYEYKFEDAEEKVKRMKRHDERTKNPEIMGYY